MDKTPRNKASKSIAKEAKSFKKRKKHGKKIKTLSEPKYSNKEKTPTPKEPKNLLKQK